MTQMTLPAVVQQIATICHAETSDTEAVETLRSLKADLAKVGIVFSDVIQLNLKGLLPGTDEASSENIAWIDFISAGTRRLGKSKGFQQAFLEANPEYKWGDLAKWRRTNKVPAEALEKLRTSSFKSPYGRRAQDWNPEEKEFLRQTLEASPKIEMVALAEVLSNHFGRTITEGAAKAAKARLKQD